MENSFLEQEARNFTLYVFFWILLTIISTGTVCKSVNRWTEVLRGVSRSNQFTASLGLTNVKLKFQVHKAKAGAIFMPIFLLILLN